MDTLNINCHFEDLIIFRCPPGDDDLIRSLLYDAEMTRGALANWMKENRDGSPNEKTSLK